MEFESARELKEIALDRFGNVPGASASSVGRAADKGATLLGAAVAGASARILPHIPLLTVNPLEAGFLRRPTAGFGVAVDEKEGYRLAVRYPWLDTSNAPYIDELQELSEGELDVDWTGPLVAGGLDDSWHRSRCRPLKVGTSVAQVGGRAGTITGFVRRGGGAPELLTCNHVIADCGRASPDAAIYQPGPADGGDAGSTIGRLGFVHPLSREGVNVVDCALATIHTGVDLNCAGLDGFGDLAGVVPPTWYGESSEGKDVAKIGRTTETTHGRVSVVSFSQYINYPGWGRCFFDDLIEVKAEEGTFSRGGDSGSLVFTPGDRCAVGMIIAGTESGKSFVSRIDSVLARLSAELVF